MIRSFSFSRVLIALSFFITIIGYIYPTFFIFGLNKVFISSGNYLVYIFQLFFSNFLHGDMLHFLFNSVFIFIFGTPLELLIGRKKYISFFIFIVFFNGILVTLFSGDSTNTIGISGFCMAILSYYVMELKSRNNPEYKGGITAIVLNVAIGLTPGISLYGHLFGAIGGVLFYLINRDFFKEKYVGEVS